MCQYHSRVYSRRTHRVEELGPLFKASIITIGQHYEQNLRYPGAGPTPGSLIAETPAQERRTKEARDEAINEVVEGVAEELTSSDFFRTMFESFHSDPISHFGDIDHDSPNSDVYRKYIQRWASNVDDKTQVSQDIVLSKQYYQALKSFKDVCDHPGHNRSTFNPLVMTVNEHFYPNVVNNGKISPGSQRPGCKSLGKTLPAGYIAGGWATISPLALKHLALCLFRGKTQKLGDWGDPFL